MTTKPTTKDLASSALLRLERDLEFECRMMDRALYDLSEITWERDCWWLYRLEGPSEAVH